MNWKNISKILCMFAIVLSWTIMAGIEHAQVTWGKTPPNTQVVNNSGDILYQVDVGDIVFTENINECDSGCSTGFIHVAAGTNDIVVYQSQGSDGESVGSLGLFENNKNYAVNILPSGDGYCAELWQRLDTSGTFNEDQTKILISPSCQ